MDNYKFFKDEYNKRNLELELGERSFVDEDEGEDREFDDINDEESKRIESFHDKKFLELPDHRKNRPSASAERTTSNNYSTLQNIMNCLSLCSRERMERIKSNDDAPRVSKETADILLSTPTHKTSSYSFLNQSYNFSPVLKNITNDAEEVNKVEEACNKEVVDRKVSYEVKILEEHMRADIIKEYFRRVNAEQIKESVPTEVPKKKKPRSSDTQNSRIPIASNFIELCNFNHRSSVDQELIGQMNNNFEPRVLVFKEFSPKNNKLEIEGQVKFNKEDLFEANNDLNSNAEEFKQEMSENGLKADFQENKNSNEKEGIVQDRSALTLDLEGGETCLNIEELNSLGVLVQEVIRSPSFFYQIKNVTHSELNDEKDLRKWKEQLIPDLKLGLNRSKVLQRVKNMVLKKSIPSSIRGKVWLQLVGNKCQINKKYFRLLELKLLEQPIDAKTDRIIVFDIKRTYPNLSILSPGSELNMQLTKLLSMFHTHRSDIGYVQGMAYPALIMLYHLETYEAFKCFTNLILGNEFILLLYRFKLKTLQAYFRTFDFFLNKYHPKVFQHLRNLQISSEIYLIEWLFTLLSRAYEIGLVIKIWDLFLIDGEIVFFQNFIAIFKMMEKDLLKCHGEDILAVLKDGTANLDPALLFKYTVQSKLNAEEFSKVLLIEKKKSV